MRERYGGRHARSLCGNLPLTAENEKYNRKVLQIAHYNCAKFERGPCEENSILAHGYTKVMDVIFTFFVTYS